MAATSTRKQSLHEYAAFLMDQVDIVDLFEYLGLFNDGNLRVRGGKIIGRCIMPDHPNPDNPTAFCVDIDKKVYICRTKCRSGGNIITLLERLRGYSFKEAIQFLEDYLGIDSDAALRKTQRRAAQFKKRQEQPGNVRAPIELPEYRFIDAYPPAPKWVRIKWGRSSGLLRSPLHHPRLLSLPRFVACTRPQRQAGRTERTDRLAGYAGTSKMAPHEHDEKITPPL